MSPKVENIVKQTLELPSQVRAFIAERLLESLDFEEPFEVGREWKNEITKRCRQIDQRNVELIAGDKIFKQAIKRMQR